MLAIKTKYKALTIQNQKPKLFLTHSKLIHHRPFRQYTTYPIHHSNTYICAPAIVSNKSLSGSQILVSL